MVAEAGAEADSEPEAAREVAEAPAKFDVDLEREILLHVWAENFEAVAEPPGHDLVGGWASDDHVEAVWF